MIELESKIVILLSKPNQIYYPKYYYLIYNIITIYSKKNSFQNNNY